MGMGSMQMERLFCMCFSCGKIGHKVKECSWNRSEIIATINRQLNRIHNLFNVRVGVDINENHFSPDAKAFATHSARRTSSVQLAIEGDDLVHLPFNY